MCMYVCVCGESISKRGKNVNSWWIWVKGTWEFSSILVTFLCLKLFQNRNIYQLKVFACVLTQTLCFGHHRKNEKKAWPTATLRSSPCVWCPGTPSLTSSPGSWNQRSPGFRQGGLEEGHPRPHTRKQQEFLLKEPLHVACEDMWVLGDRSCSLSSD